MPSGYLLFALEIVVPDRGALFPGHSSFPPLTLGQKPKTEAKNEQSVVYAEADGDS